MEPEAFRASRCVFAAHLFSRTLLYLSGEVFPRRRFGEETQRAPSLPLVTPPLGFPRYCVPEELSKERWKVGH